MTQTWRIRTESSEIQRQAVRSSAMLSAHGGGSSARRESSVWTMFAWISTPLIRPIGVP